MWIYFQKSLQQFCWLPLQSFRRSEFVKIDAGQIVHKRFKTETHLKSSIDCRSLVSFAEKRSCTPSIILGQSTESHPSLVSLFLIHLKQTLVWSAVW